MLSTPSAGHHSPWTASFHGSVVKDHYYLDTMASVVADVEAGLQAMLNLKPPGVSGSRITSLTTLCVNNIQVGFLTRLSAHITRTC